jgi:mannose-1-phosphate guanylyltransferase
MNHAVILAGGGGTRLWPASRRALPKQLLPLAPGGETLLHATWRRAAGVSREVGVVTAADQAAGVARAVPEVPADQVLAEPRPRNTAAAVGLAAVTIAARDPDAVLGILPADHHIGDEPGWQRVVAQAFAVAAAEDAIVTVGITPTRPDTGFGYLEPGAAAAGGARQVARFVEKPDRASAEAYVARGYLWNAGMFFFRAARMLAELDRHLPDVGAGLRRIAAAPEETGAIYPGLTSISIDHGVMEKTRGILTLAGDFGWSDVGSWDALAEVRAADAAGNVAEGQAVLVDAKENIIHSDAGVVAVVGVSGLVVVRSGNAVLVVPRERAQDVREVVKKLEQGDGDAYV